MLILGVVSVLCPLWGRTWLHACLNVEGVVGVHHLRWRRYVYGVRLSDSVYVLRVRYRIELHVVVARSSTESKDLLLDL